MKRPDPFYVLVAAILIAYDFAAMVFVWGLWEIGKATLGAR